MILSMNYSVSARDVLHNPEFPTRLKWMKSAGVDNLWIAGYHFGHHESDPEMMYRARLLLKEEGMSTGVISLPVGHPGNSLNPDDPTLDLSINPAWHYRIDRHGNKEYFIACLDSTLTADNLAAAKEYAQAGFTRHFFDDDLRLGNWGDQVQGCFCDDCIARFNRENGLSLTRPQLAAACDGEKGMEDIREAWIRYNCGKLTTFMAETRVPEMTSGIMVMHNGGRPHGISIPDIKKVVPDCLFRVGEYHFDDESYLRGHESLASGVREHLRLIGDNQAYSESTVFPAAAMSPENFLRRIKQELRLGLRHIFLMSGSWFFTEPYWKMLAENRAALNDLAASLDAK